ncbi:MAG: HAD-IB family hydrolase [Acidimicrobiales bacterium]
MSDLRLPGSVAEVDASPEGPEVGAFFDFDGTLIAGYSAGHLSKARLKSGDISVAELARTIGVAVGAGMGRADFADLLRVGAEAWKGRPHEELVEMGERLFEDSLAAVVYPEARALVVAHLDRGHTVVVSSSATEYQVEPMARYLGVDHVLCNRFGKEDGRLDGTLDDPVIWGTTKADTVQHFAADSGVDLNRSYFYADGDEDIALMYLVGHPRPTNPGSRLAKVAEKRGWPILRFTDPSPPSRLDQLRQTLDLRHHLRRSP